LKARRYKPGLRRFMMCLSDRSWFLFLVMGAYATRTRVGCLAHGLCRRLARSLSLLLDGPHIGPGSLYVCRAPLVDGLCYLWPLIVAVLI